MFAGVYLHIPFCKSRCSYCDFATDVYRSSDAVDRYVEALCSEIQGGNLISSEGAGKLIKGTLPIGPHPLRDALAEPAGRVSATYIDTVYFGGGTPSLLTPKQTERILDSVRTKFDTGDNAEITMEMNPATVTPETLTAYRELGVNRASFGVQTFNDRDLKLLARGHDANDARNTFKMLRAAGFENISFDLIAGLPGQMLDDWQRNLDEALAMQPEHLSLYLLEIHEATPLAEQIRSKRQPMPDENIAAEMYELMLDKVAAAGYEQYEISNFCKAGYESRHNTKYWRLDPVYGFGVSAHSFDGFQRYSNERDTAKYVEQIENLAHAEATLERSDTASEFIFLGLRLNEGIDLSDYQDRFHTDLLAKYREELERLQNAELIEVSDGRLRLTRKGMLFSNEVFAVFV